MEPLKSEFTSVSPTTKGLKLYAETWTPASPPVAVLVFIHGLGDHVGRYADAFRHLAGAGVAVHTFDQVAHGKSPPHPTRGRFNCASFTDLVDDVDAFGAATVARYATSASPPPVFLAGQSMGGLLACHALLRSKPRWAGLLLLSAAIDVPMTLTLHVQSFLSPLLVRLIPDAEMVPAVHEKDLSRDPAVVAAHASDELVQHKDTKVKIATEISKGFRSLSPRYSELDIPLLALHGTADKVTSLAAVERLFNGSGSKDKKLSTWDGAFHELLKETCTPEVLVEVTGWITERARSKL